MKLIMAGVFIVVIVFIVIGIFLLNGKGAWLIAGYNTMPKKDKEKYDKKALCRFTGYLMLGISFCVLLIGMDEYLPDYELAFIGSGLIMISSIFAVIYANTGKRFLKDKSAKKRRW